MDTSELVRLLTLPARPQAGVDRGARNRSRDAYLFVRYGPWLVLEVLRHSEGVLHEGGRTPPPISLVTAPKKLKDAEDAQESEANTLASSRDTYDPIAVMAGAERPQ